MRQLYLILLILTATAATAQNRIDRFIDSESTHGSSKFTSVVERDPETREVVRVVKVRELTRGIDINTCQERFEAERTSGRYSHKVEGDASAPQHTFLLAVDGEHQNRIYMLQYTGQRAMQGRDGRVTVVVKMKKKQTIPPAPPL